MLMHPYFEIRNWNARNWPFLFTFAASFYIFTRCYSYLKLTREWLLLAFYWFHVLHQIPLIHTCWAIFIAITPLQLLQSGTHTWQQLRFHNSWSLMTCQRHLRAMEVWLLLGKHLCLSFLSYTTMSAALCFSAEDCETLWTISMAKLDDLLCRGL